MKDKNITLESLIADLRNRVHTEGYDCGYSDCLEESFRREKDFLEIVKEAEEVLGNYEAELNEPMGNLRRRLQSLIKEAERKVK